MKILIVTEVFEPMLGGQEKILVELCKGLQKNGHSVRVVSGPVRPDASVSPLPPEGIHVDYYTLNTAGQIATSNAIDGPVQTLNAALQDFQPDVISAHISPGIAFLLKLTEKANQNIPIAASLHAGFEALPNATGALGYGLQRADAISAVSAATLRSVIGLLPDVASKARVIYNGLSPSSQIPVGETRTGQSEPVSKEIPYLVFSGRIVPEKGLATLLTSIALLVPTFPEIRLKIVGDGPYQFALRSLADTLGITNNCDFVGWKSTDETEQIASGAIAAIVPSIWAEPFGLVALEATAAGVPVIASRVGGLPEIIRHRHNGLLVIPGCPFSLAVAIETILKDPAMAAEMGERGRIAGKAFSPEKMIQDYEDLFSAAVTRRASMLTANAQPVSAMGSV